MNWAVITEFFSRKPVEDEENRPEETARPWPFTLTLPSCGVVARLYLFPRLPRPSQ